MIFKKEVGSYIPMNLGIFSRYDYFEVTKNDVVMMCLWLLFRMQNLTAQLDKIKITHQKKEELVAEKSSKAKEVDAF